MESSLLQFVLGIFIFWPDYKLCIITTDTSSRFRPRLCSDLSMTNASYIDQNIINTSWNNYAQHYYKSESQLSLLETTISNMEAFEISRTRICVVGVLMISLTTAAASYVLYLIILIYVCIILRLLLISLSLLPFLHHGFSVSIRVILPFNGTRK